MSLQVKFTTARRLRAGVESTPPAPSSTRASTFMPLYPTRWVTSTRPARVERRVMRLLRGHQGGVVVPATEGEAFILRVQRSHIHGCTHSMECVRCMISCARQ